jgi:hypothetical protein
MPGEGAGTVPAYEAAIEPINNTAQLPALINVFTRTLLRCVVASARCESGQHARTIMRAPISSTKGTAQNSFASPCGNIAVGHGALTAQKTAAHGPLSPSPRRARTGAISVRCTRESFTGSGRSSRTSSTVRRPSRTRESHRRRAASWPLEQSGVRTGSDP